MRLAGPVDLSHSLLGGQAFLWQADGAGRFRGIVGQAPVDLTQRANGAFEASGAARAELASYFRLERADRARRDRLAKDPVLVEAMAAIPGLRLLRQDPWQTTVAFLTSANNNVPRIELILHALVARYGEPLVQEEAEPRPSSSSSSLPHALSPPSALRPPPSALRSFPSPAALARAPIPALRACGLGYRAPFLRETARLVARGDVDLASLRGAPREEVREALLTLPGVGPKVADCIALFALDVDDAFPMDRWMLRAMEESFADAMGRPGRGAAGRRGGVGDRGKARRPEDVADFARERWGRDAGLAQQYLFHAIRMREGSHGTARLRAGPA